MKDPNDLPPNTDAPDHTHDSGELPRKALFDSITPNTHVDHAALDAWAKNNPPGPYKTDAELRVDYELRKIAEYDLDHDVHTLAFAKAFGALRRAAAIGRDQGVKSVLAYAKSLSHFPDGDWTKSGPEIFVEDFREKHGATNTPEPTADPVKRWPFAESPGNLAKRLTGTLADIGCYVTREFILSALRTVLIEQPPRLAPWLDPGAAAKDSARLNLIEIALKHAFALFRPGGADVTPEAILALGKSYDVLDAASRVETVAVSKGLPVLKVKDGDEWRCYDALFWRPDGVLEVDLAPSADERGKPVELAQTPKSAANPEDLAFARSLGNLTDQLLPTKPKPKHASDAQRHAALVALEDHMYETVGLALEAKKDSATEAYVRLANFVADAVVGAEQ